METSPIRLIHPARGVVVALASAALWLPLSQSAAAKETVAFVIDDPRITSSSGLATDMSQQLYWTINDSDDSGVAYALDPNGRTLGTLTYQATPTDVEAIAYRDGRLYLGDTGGNREPRTVIRVYEFDQPKPNNQDQEFQTRDFRYPDGPHDSEALLVGPSRQLFVVTKGPAGGSIFVAPTGPAADGQPGVLRPVGDAPPYVTDGTFLPDGRIVLRSYVGLYVLDPTTFQIAASAPTPTLEQGESVTLDQSGQSLLIGTEGERSKVLRVPIPSTIRPVPTIPPPSPTLVPVPSPAASATSAPLPGQGWLSAGVIAGIVVVVGVVGAVVAAVAVVVARRR